MVGLVGLEGRESGLRNVGDKVGWISYWDGLGSREGLGRWGKSFIYEGFVSRF